MAIVKKTLVISMLFGLGFELASSTSAIPYRRLCNASIIAGLSSGAALSVLLLKKRRLYNAMLAKRYTPQEFLALNNELRAIERACRYLAVTGTASLGLATCMKLLVARSVPVEPPLKDSLAAFRKKLRDGSIPLGGGDKRSRAQAEEELASLEKRAIEESPRDMSEEREMCYQLAYDLKLRSEGGLRTKDEVKEYLEQLRAPQKKKDWFVGDVPLVSGESGEFKAV